MPYTEAVIMEVMRHAAIVPTAIQHATTQDYIPNLYNSLWSAKVWGDPGNFRPERLLSSDELKVVCQEALIPFSIGKCVYLGETLARDELILFVTSLIQWFQFGTDYSRSPKPDPTDYIKGQVCPTLMCWCCKIASRDDALNQVTRNDENHTK